MSLAPSALPRRFAFSDRDLESYVCGAASPELERAVLAEAGRSPELAAYLRERQAERDAFFVEQPYLVPVPAEPRRRTWPLASWLLSGAAVAVLFVWLLPAQPQSDHERDGVRPKGGVNLRLVVSREGAAPFEATAETIFYAGDRLQLVATSPTAGYLTLAGREGERTVVYFANWRVEPGVAVAPHSLRLDDLPGPERWRLVVSEAPLDDTTLADGPGLWARPGLSLSLDKRQAP